MDYNSIYRKQSVYGAQPTPILVEAKKILSGEYNHISFLDIGSGQGRDSVYIAEGGNVVDSVDSSEVACAQLSDTAKQKGLDIHVYNCDINDFKIKKNKYNLISAINIFHFLDKKSALEIINQIKNAISVGGIVVISLLLDNRKFEHNEMLKIFNDFEVLHCVELDIDDKGHSGQNEPHKHTVSRIIAKKIINTI